MQLDAGLDLDDNGDLFRTVGIEGALQFVGEPNDEIDANWELLIRK